MAQGNWADILDAVKNYYGTGSDQWTEIATYGLTSEDAATILKNVPGVNTVTNQKGQVLEWTYDVGVRNTSQVTSDINNINSNMSPTTYTSKIPAIMSETVETGKLSAISGVGYKASTGLTVGGVMSTVSTALGAVSVGATLGKIVSKGIYKAGTDIFHADNLEKFDPDTWQAFTSEDGIGGTVLNVLLGLESDDTVQMYMNEDAVAYYAGYLNNEGFFTKDYYISKGGTVGEYNIPSGLLTIGGSTGTTKLKDRYYDTIPVGEYDGMACVTNATTMSTKYKYLYDDVNGVTIAVTDNFNAPKNVGVYRTNGENAISLLTKTYTYDNKTVRYGTDGKASERYKSYINNKNITIPVDVLAWYLKYGSFDNESREGVGTQENAKTPDLSTAKTITEILNTLKNQFPELWENAVIKSVLQPDGTYKDYTYIPVASGVTTDDITQPITGTTTQANPAINTKTATLTELSQLAQELGRVQTPTDIDTASQTGNGSTPSLVVPVGSASALYRVYNPTQEQLNSFGGWLWSSDFVDQLLKLFNDPMQAIIGLHKVFSPVPVGGTDVIKVGYLSSGVSSNWVNEQYVTIDCGSVSVSEHFGNVLDYDPYTQIYIYLPFIGIETLKVGDVMRSTVNVIYHCDVLTGACLAEIHCVRDGNNATMYTFSGNCAVQYPISSGSYMGIVSSIASVVGGAVGTIASGGSMLPVAMSGINATMNAHTNVSHSGGFSGNSGAMGVKQPYLIITRPQSIIPNDIQALAGLSANNSTTLSNCLGVVKVEKVNLSGITATNHEKSMIESLLKEGVIM